MSFPDPKILELQHLGFRHLLPHPMLRPWVQGYWSVHQPRLQGAPLVERTYPDGGSTLSFSFSSASNEQAINAILAQPLASKAMSIHGNLFGIRFHPGGAYQLLGLPPAAADMPPLDHRDLEWPELETLYVQLAEIPALERATLADHWLLAQAAKRDLRPGLVQTLWPQLLDMEDLATLYQEAGISRRTLERRFLQEVGLAPAQLRQLLRIRRARYLIKRSPSMALTDIALAAGYFDQSHFIHHFRTMVGETPGQYRERQLQRVKKGELVLV